MAPASVWIVFFGLLSASSESELQNSDFSVGTPESELTNVRTSVQELQNVPTTTSRSCTLVAGFMLVRLARLCPPADCKCISFDVIINSIRCGQWWCVCFNNKCEPMFWPSSHQERAQVRPPRHSRRERKSSGFLHISNACKMVQTSWKSYASCRSRASSLSSLRVLG